jgi:hypothetical protein
MTSSATPITPDEFMLIGAAIYQAQKIEWALYGIASHASHLQVAQCEKRFKQLTPEAFLRGDPAEFKATFGQIASVFGDSFLISGPELEQFIADRNLIVHDFYRLFYANIHNGHRRDDPVGFLKDFIRRGEFWLAIVRGFLVCLKEAAAKKEGRVKELAFTEKDLVNKDAYQTHARKVAERFLQKSGA